MTTPVHSSETGLTYEQIVGAVLESLREGGALLPGSKTIPWAAFLRLSDLVHETFDVPSTTFTPIMRRFLFGLGLAASPRSIVGVGTYVGYTFAWLLRDRSASDSAPFFETALGIDVDANANQLARSNCAALNHGERLRFVEGDGPIVLAGLEFPIDLLYVDLDDPLTGKIAYKNTLESALPHLRPGAVVVAHDACVSKFAADLAVYHNFIRQCDSFLDPWILPIDSCGLSLTVKK